MTAGHELQVVHDDAELAAALTIALPRAVTKLALDGHFRALRKVGLQLLATGAEHGAVDEIRVILPFTGLLVLAAGVDRDAEPQDGHTALRGTNFCVARKISADHDTIDAHVYLPLLMLGPCGPLRNPIRGRCVSRSCGEQRHQRCAARDRVLQPRRDQRGNR